MNSPFLVPPEPERVRADWSRLGRADRQTFLSVVGIRAAVREYGLSVLEVALALDRGFERSYELVRRLASDDPAPPH